MTVYEFQTAQGSLLTSASGKKEPSRPAKVAQALVNCESVLTEYILFWIFEVEMPFAF